MILRRSQKITILHKIHLLDIKSSKHIMTKDKARKKSLKSRENEMWKGQQKNKEF